MMHLIDFSDKIICSTWGGRGNKWRHYEYIHIVVTYDNNKCIYGS